MRYSTTSGMVLAALSIGQAVAGPAHAHLHKKMHEKKDVDWAALDWANMGIDWSSAYEAGLHSSTAAAVVAAATHAAAVTTTAAAAKATSTTNVVAAASSAVASIVDDIKELYNGLEGQSNSRTSFGKATAASGSLGDGYVGNVGSPYGSNVIKVSSASDYDFTMTFVNTASSGMTINIWQKQGIDGQSQSGSALAPKNTTLTFYLAKGASQVVAIQDNTQLAWAQSCSATIASGAFATTWGEANFVSTGSGYDVSAIVNPNKNNYDMTITSTEAPNCKSSRTENMWIAEYTPVGDSDGSCYIAQSTAHLTVKMGGTV